MSSNPVQQRIPRANVFAILPGLVPSTLMHITTPLIELHQAQLLQARVTLEMFVKERDIEWSDLLIFCRNVEPRGIRWLTKILEKKKPFIYDIDDNLLETPVGASAGQYHISPERIAMLERYIRNADLVRVYSEAMFERTKLLNPNAVKVNGYVDWNLLTKTSQPKEKGPIKIVYATSRVDDNLGEIFKPALTKILEKYSSRVQIFFLGYNPLEYRSYPNVYFKPLNLNYERFMRYFSGAGFDIGLAPLLDDVFHRSKTNLKVREFGACRIAGIYSDVDTYSTSITHKQNGFLVKNTPGAWYDAMSTLIENQELRFQIQKQAYQYAQENFSQEAFTQLWYSQINEILNQPLNKQVMEFEVLIEIPDKNATFYDRKDLLETMPGCGLWLAGVFHRLVSGIKSKGITYLLFYIRMKIQMFWALLKIKFNLF